jgi:hypothetical protein
MRRDARIVESITPDVVRFPQSHGARRIPSHERNVTLLVNET